MTKLLTLDVLFSTAIKAVVVVAKLVILDILFLTSFILALTESLVAKLAYQVFYLQYFLSTLDFKLAKSTVLANFDVSKPVAFL